jgi:putative Mg2+ transporter-C (MgtC) family protein
MLLDFDDIALRLSAATLIGVLIGINHDLQNKRSAFARSGSRWAWVSTVAVSGIQFPGIAENPDAACRIV